MKASSLRLLYSSGTIYLNKDRKIIIRILVNTTPVFLSGIVKIIPDSKIRILRKAILLKAIKLYAIPALSIKLDCLSLANVYSLVSYLSSEPQLMVEADDPSLRVSPGLTHKY
jgi:hypothetical protein